MRITSKKPIRMSLSRASATGALAKEANTTESGVRDAVKMTAGAVTAVALAPLNLVQSLGAVMSETEIPEEFLVGSAAVAGALALGPSMTLAAAGAAVLAAPLMIGLAGLASLMGSDAADSFLNSSFVESVRNVGKEIKGSVRESFSDSMHDFWAEKRSQGHDKSESLAETVASWKALPKGLAAGFESSFQVGVGLVDSRNS